jgi:Na+/H+-translocating membrane pyrophosphatase
MHEIAMAIHEGAMVFLKREYQLLAVFVLVVFALPGWFINGSTAVAFLAGAACSMLAGYFGMEAAPCKCTHGSGRQSVRRGAGAHAGLLRRGCHGVLGGKPRVDRD